jgi:DNA-binding LytR/AlgR family response regulator
VIVSSVVGTFSTARDIGWRLASPGNLWEPAMWYATSNAVTLAILPLMRRAALLIRAGAGRWRLVVPAVLGLALAYGTIHIVGMFLFRKLAYAASGWHWTIDWGLDQVVYEARKDLFSFVALTSIFWIAERSRAQATPTPAGERAAATSADAPSPTGLWLRDGRTSLLVDPREILTVASAGNYVEYVLADGRRHLIRATLQAEETRLAAFGIARVHRTRLINLKRVVALESRPSGDFDIRLDSGEVVVGSRRFRNAVADLGG